MQARWVVTEAAHPQCCEVCSTSTHPGVMLAWLPGSDDDQELIPCLHCAGAWWFVKFLEGKK
jgi:hypothetical protein